VFQNVVGNFQTHSFFIPISLWRWNRQSVLKRRWEFSNLVILHTYLPMKLEQSVSKRRWEFSNLVILHTYLPMKMEQTECSKTSAYRIETPGNYPEESIQCVVITYTGSKIRSVKQSMHILWKQCSKRNQGPWTKSVHYFRILGFVVLCLLKYSNKTPNQMQQLVVKFIA
jgi:hypothetical protein